MSHRFAPLARALGLAATVAVLAGNPGAALAQSPAGLANPASRHCVDSGGRLTIEKDAQGGEVGICRFPGNRQCEEWALFRGECPQGGLPAPTGPSGTAPLRAVFACAGGKSIVATFAGGSAPGAAAGAPATATLELSDGRRLVLPQALSASGARYATPDERVVFWNKGDSAFLEERGQATYEGCRQRP